VEVLSFMLNDRKKEINGEKAEDTEDAEGEGRSKVQRERGIEGVRRKKN